jgi:DUF1680 family protein
VDHRSFVTGGHGDNEHFFPPSEFAKHLPSAKTMETCGTHNMLRLTRMIFQGMPLGGIADFYEHALYNGILASQDPDGGMMTYFQATRPGYVRLYHTPEQSFWCCTGTGVENHSKYAGNIYFYNETNLYVNLFIASELDWKSKGLKLRQETAFPEGGGSELQLSCDKPVELALHLRHPFWANAGFEIRVNGEKLSPSDAASYVVISRTWKTGDRITLKMPFSLRTEAFKDNPNRFAVMYGPLVLCAPVEDRKVFPAIVADNATLLMTGNGPVAVWLDTASHQIAARRFDGRISGLFAYDEAIGACILLNANHPRERRTRTAAHEMGHLVSTRRQPEVFEDRTENSREERYATAFGLRFFPCHAAIGEVH